MPFGKRSYRRKAKKYGKAIAKGTVRAGYTVGKGLTKRYRSNPMALFNDVMLLKSIVNAEKKQLNLTSGSAGIGQVNGNAEGAYTIDITPAPAQGVGDSQRVGDSIKLYSALFNFNFRHMSSTSSPMAVVIEVWEVLGAPQATSTFLNQLLLPTPFITGANIRDANAMIDQDYRQQYKLVSRRKTVVAPDSSTGVAMIKNLKIPLKFGKFGHHVKYAEGTSTVAAGQLMLLIRTDSGNISAGTASTLGNVPVAGVNTGLSLNRSFTYYYYDN